MTPVPEIIIFTAEKDYQDNPDAVTKAAVERLGGVPGIQESVPHLHPNYRDVSAN